MESRHLRWPCQLNPVFEETWLVLLSTVSPRTVHLCISGGGPWSDAAHASNCLLNPVVQEIWLGSSAQDCAFMVIIKNHHYSILLSIVTFKGKLVLRPKVFPGVLSISYNQKRVHISLSRKLYFTSTHTIYIHWSLPYVWHKVKYFLCIVIGVNLQWNKIQYLSYSYILAEKKFKRVAVMRNNLKGLFMLSAMEIVLKSYKLHCSDMSSFPLVKRQPAEPGV